MVDHLRYPTQSSLRFQLLLPFRSCRTNRIVISLRATGGSVSGTTCNARVLNMTLPTTVVCSGRVLGVDVGVSGVQRPEVQELDELESCPVAKPSFACNAAEPCVWLCAVHRQDHRRCRSVNRPGRSVHRPLHTELRVQLGVCEPGHREHVHLLPGHRRVLRCPNRVDLLSDQRTVPACQSRNIQQCSTKYILKRQPRGYAVLQQFNGPD